jgi:hypothetical protein
MFRISSIQRQPGIWTRLYFAGWPSLIPNSVSGSDVTISVPHSRSTLSEGFAIAPPGWADE